jgi:lipopolysaccharide export system ATP-binding protein
VSSRLVAEGLEKSFRGHKVVDGVSLEVAEGEVVGLLGPNGAGKTTAFKLMLGLLPPDRGTVSFDGSLDGLPLHLRARRGLGYLPQGASVFRGLDARDNLLAVLEARGHPDPAARAESLLDRFGLGALAGRRAGSLSGGERRRLEFARALASSPRLLLIDEPFAGVDPLAAREISAAIADLARDGVGVLLTDHAVREALGASDRVYVIAGGRIVVHGTPSEVVRSDLARRLYLGDGFDAPA